MERIECIATIQERDYYHVTIDVYYKSGRSKTFILCDLYSDVIPGTVSRYMSKYPPVVSHAAYYDVFVYCPETIF